MSVRFDSTKGLLFNDSFIAVFYELCRCERSTRRQISRFISALQDVERNQGTICFTFLDVENYFNTISSPALFLLLRKFGMNENDVQALESYYEHSHISSPALFLLLRKFGMNENDVQALESYYEHSHITEYLYSNSFQCQ